MVKDDREKTEDKFDRGQANQTFQTGETETSVNKKELVKITELSSIADETYITLFYNSIVEDGNKPDKNASSDHLKASMLKKTAVKIRLQVLIAKLK